MKCWKFLFLLMILFGLSGCEKHGRDKVYKIGIVNRIKGTSEAVSGFKKGMEEAGYREGRNVVYLHAEEVLEEGRIETVVKDLAARKVDLVYTLSTPASLTAKKILADSGIPLLFAPVFCPIDVKLVDSLGSTGGNLTGVKVRGSIGKALETLLTVCPNVRTIFIPFHEKNRPACLTVEDLQKDASRLGVELILARVDSEEDIDRVMSAIPKKADAVWLTCSHLMVSNSTKIVKAATLAKLPVAASTALHNNGVLVSYGPNDFTLGKQASRIADKILRGVPAANIPVETTEFFLGINLKTAQSLNIKVPESVLSRADFIVR